MSEICIEKWSMPVADFGAENPYPQFPAVNRASAVQVSPEIPPEMARNMAYGRLPGILPYTLQDGYTRERTAQPVKVAVLENDILKAAFLLDYGGRLWSLVHKPDGRELLYRNSVIQPGNLAHRNAWFCGGVEWNTGATGHTPFTCAPLFAGQLKRQDGTPVLRLYEYERWRGVTYQIDACLPDGLPVLLVQVTLRNPNLDETPIYWWSNIAVPESEHVRVVVPAERAFHFDLERSGLGLVPTPIYQGIDYTYTTRLDHAADFFFDIPTSQRPFICALDGEGRGLVQTSTARLKGRKLFLWGTGRGGKRWQEFLSPEGGSYLEIQAGLANTQLEHLPMPGGARWSWIEAYGLVEADSQAVHGVDWGAARRSVEASLDRLIPAERLEEEYRLGSQVVESAIDQLLHSGSGWGAVEERRRQFASEPPIGGAHLPFSVSQLTPPLAAWLSLLETGQMGGGDEMDFAPAFQVAPPWHDLLERACAAAGKQDWLGWYSLGVSRAQNGSDGAKQAFETSLALRDTPWCRYGLAMLAWRAGQVEEATRHFREALHLRPDDIALTIEAGRFLIESGQAEAFLVLLNGAPQPVHRWGRVRLLEARAALHAGWLDLIEQFFTGQVEVPDLREGEESLSKLWLDYQKARLAALGESGLSEREIERRFPIPAAFDFRMRVD